MRVRRATVFAAVAALALGAAPTGGAAPAPLQTGVIYYSGTGPEANVAFSRIHGAGARYVKLFLNWRATAANGRPDRPSDPADPAYNWDGFDTSVRRALANGLTPVVMVAFGPAWATTASDGWAQPDPVELGYFARAAATRYSGSYAPPTAEFPYSEAVLPRIRYWQVWNEPNLLYYLSPQYQGGRLVSADRYRSMVNRFTASVKAVHGSNLVLAGGTGPFRRTQNSAPLTFMREFLCLRSNLTRKPGCGPVRFDIWGHHPYTSGGPTHTAISSQDVSLGDLPEMSRVLRAAARRGTIRSTGGVRFWVDEFSWDTRPPDPGGIPTGLHARWTAEGIYRMWKAGVSLVLWLQLVDNEWTGRCGDAYQAGLYFYSRNIAAARPKRSLAAFRFPFVAFRDRGRVLVWGRTPGSVPARVVVERRTRSGWRRMGVLRTSASGVFTTRFGSAGGSNLVRARFGPWFSLPFSLTPVRDRFFNPFGQAPLPSCYN